MTLEAMAGQEDTDYCIRVQLAGTPLVFVPDAVMHVRFRDTVSGVFAQAWAWAESGAYVQRRYAASPATSALVAGTAYDLARHLAWKLVRVRSRADVAAWIWLAGWCGGLIDRPTTAGAARVHSERPLRCAVVLQTPQRSALRRVYRATSRSAPRWRLAGTH